MAILIEDLNLRKAERELVWQALHRTQGNIAQAAVLLGVTRHAVRRRMIKHGIERSYESQIRGASDE